MENKEFNLNKNDIELLLGKKSELLNGLLLISQRQIMTNDDASLKDILDKKDTFIEQLKKTDFAIEEWSKIFGTEIRDKSGNINKTLAQIKECLSSIEETENQFEKWIRDQRFEIAKELKDLKKSEKFKNYFKTTISSGRRFSLKQ